MRALKILKIDDKVVTHSLIFILTSDYYLIRANMNRKRKSLLHWQILNLVAISRVGLLLPWSCFDLCNVIWYSSYNITRTIYYIINHLTFVPNICCASYKGRNTILFLDEFCADRTFYGIFALHLGITFEKWVCLLKDFNYFSNSINSRVISLSTFKIFLMQ